jgi:hypothetical protein
MVMTQLWWLLPKVNPRMSRKLPRVKLMLTPCKETLKQMLMLKELRCEGVEVNVSEHMFCKDICPM